MILRPASFTDIEPYAAPAKREHVTIEDRPNTQWFLIAPEAVVGCFGLRRMSASVWRIVGVYVDPQRRGLGFGTKATEQAIEMAGDVGVSVEAVAYNPSWYVARGFEVRKVYLNGGTLVRLNK